MLSASIEPMRTMNDEDEPLLVREDDFVKVRVPLSSILNSYVIDFAALLRGDSPKEGEQAKANDALDKEEEEQDGKPRRRRREEAEEYDLDDPFIDDDELPPGATLEELLNGIDPTGGEGETVSPAIVDTDFYVWKGKLPEREVDPLWMEKAIEAQSNRKRKNKKKRPASNKSRKRSIAQEEQDSSGSAVVVKVKERAKKRTKSPKAKRSKRDSDKSISTTAKPRSIMDRIAAIGTADDEYFDTEVVAGNNASEQSQEKLHQDEQEHANGTADENEERMEEKMRKKFDISTPFLELELKLSMETVKRVASQTEFSDPRKFPSTLRPFVNEAIACCLRRQEKKNTLAEGFFEELASSMPFSANSLEKLTFSKLAPLYRDELQAKVIPQLLEEIKVEITQLDTTTATAASSTKTGKFNERIRQLLLDVIKCELDKQALDRMITVKTGGKYTSFSETKCRKAFYPKVAACWPEGVMGTVELAREYTTVKRRHELKKLKEHNIEVIPTLVPISTKSKGGEACKTEGSRTESQLNSQLDGEAAAKNNHAEIVSASNSQVAHEGEAVQAVEATGETPAAHIPSFLETVLNSTPINMTNLLSEQAEEASDQ